MNNQELQEFFLLQSSITIVILGFTALILAGLFFDILLHLFKKYIKKGDKK